MADQQPGLISRATAEIGFALFTAALGGAVVAGALEHDIGWSSSGPEAGYFPFRIGVVLIGASLVILARQLLAGRASEVLLTRDNAKALAIFAGPLVVFMVATLVVGLYLAAAVYLLLTVGVIGRVGWGRAVAVALLFPAAFFVLFEYVFRVPLPKGPLGPLFGLL